MISGEHELWDAYMATGRRRAIHEAMHRIHVAVAATAMPVIAQFRTFEEQARRAQELFRDRHDQEMRDRLRRSNHFR